MQVPCLLFHHGKIIKEQGNVFFLSDFSPVFTNLDVSWSVNQLGRHIHDRLELGYTQRITKIVYRMPVYHLNSLLICTTFDICSDNDVKTMYETYEKSVTFTNFIELFVEAVDVGVEDERTACSQQFVSEAGTSYNVGSRGMGADGAGTSSAVVSQSEVPPHAIFGSAMADHRLSNVEFDLNMFPTTGLGSGQFNVTDEFHYEAVHSDDIVANEEPLEGNNDDPDYVVGPDEGSDDDQCSPTNFFRRLNLDYEDPADTGVQIPVYNSTDPSAELAIGMTFPDKQSMLLAVKKYCLVKNVDYRVAESEPEKYYGVCKQYKQGCNWRVRARLRARSKMWEITRYEGPHTCSGAVMTQDHRKLDSDFIASSIMRMVSENPSVSISSLISHIDGKYQYMTSYKKAWIAKQKAITKIFGDWDTSYNELPRWLVTMQHILPGTVFELKTNPARNPNGTVC